jgi:hypothetical protein
MKKDHIYLSISLCIPLLFILTLWGYSAYYRAQLKPAYNFVYTSPYRSQYIDMSFKNPNAASRYIIGEDGTLNIADCKPTTEASTLDMQMSMKMGYDANYCADMDPKNQTYYLYNSKNNTNESISFDAVKTKNYSQGFKSPDGYTFRGDVHNIPDYNSAPFQNMFSTNVNNYNKGTLTNDKGDKMYIELKDSQYDRLFIGWVKN